MDKKEQILHYHRIDGLSQREIARKKTVDIHPPKTGISTVFCTAAKTYWRNLTASCRAQLVAIRIMKGGKGHE